MFLPWMSEIDGENWCLRRCRSASSRKEIKVEPSPLYRSLFFLKADDLFSLILYKRVAFVASLARISLSKDLILSATVFSSAPIPYKGSLGSG